MSRRLNWERANRRDAVVSRGPEPAWWDSLSPTNAQVEAGRQEAAKRTGRKAAKTAAKRVKIAAARARGAKRPTRAQRSNRAGDAAVARYDEWKRQLAHMPGAEAERAVDDGLTPGVR